MFSGRREPALMPRRRIPEYRCFKPKNLGLVVIDGKQRYLGRYGSPESVAEYNRLIQEWLAREPLPRTEPGSGDAALTVDALILAFWTRHAETHYRRADGTPTGELANYREAHVPQSVANHRSGRVRCADLEGSSCASECCVLSRDG